MLAYRHLVVSTNGYIDELIKYELRLSIIAFLVCSAGVLVSYILIKVILSNVMNRTIQLNKDVQMMIPTSIIMRNEVMLEFMFGREKPEEKKRRLRRQRQKAH